MTSSPMPTNLADESHVIRLSLRAWVLAAVRASLSVLGFVGSVIAGAPLENALLGWVVGAILVSIILAGDPRGRRGRAPEPLPATAVPETWRQIARTDTLPSTVGVALLTCVALPFEPVLAAILAGILGGMAVMTFVFRVRVALEERKLGGALYVDRYTRRLYVLESSH